jgi:peptidoglycan/LPS O-acetylase OafA/YrhL
MLGAYISQSDTLKRRILSTNPFIYLTIYLSSYYLGFRYNLPTGNSINFVSYIALCLLTLKLAHTRPALSKTLLDGNDLSYGIYIYHMPIVNFMLFYGFKDTVWSLLIVLMVTVGMAFMSWKFIEKPSLKLKKIALRKYI